MPYLVWSLHLYWLVTWRPLTIFLWLHYTLISNHWTGLYTLPKKSLNWYGKSLSNDIRQKTHIEWILKTHWMWRVHIIIIFFFWECRCIGIVSKVYARCALIIILSHMCLETDLLCKFWKCRKLTGGGGSTSL